MNEPPVLVVLAAGAGHRLGQLKALYPLGRRTALEHVLAAGGGPDWPSLVVLGAEAERVQARIPSGIQQLINRNWAAGRTGSLSLAARAWPGRDLLVAPVDVPLVSAETHRALRQAWMEAGAPALGWLAPGQPEPGAGSDRTLALAPPEIAASSSGSQRSGESRERGPGVPEPSARASPPRSGAPLGSPGAALVGQSAQAGSPPGPPTQPSRLRPGHPVLIGRALARRLLDFGPDQPLKLLRAEAQPCWLLEVLDDAILDDLDTPDDGRRLAARMGAELGGSPPGLDSGG